MPEGPSIVILKDAVQEFKGEKIFSVTGNSKMDIQRLAGKKIIDFKSWGKHFLICFDDVTVRIHFMLFGSYSLNQQKVNRLVRLGLHFKKGDIYFYACSVKFIEGDINKAYDWSGDVMNDTWNPRKTKKKLKDDPEALVCDVLLDQNIFAGVGNIIKMKYATESWFILKVKLALYP